MYHICFSFSDSLHSLFFFLCLLLAMPCSMWDLSFPRTEPLPPTLEAQRLNHWIADLFLLAHCLSLCLLLATGPQLPVGRPLWRLWPLHSPAPEQRLHVKHLREEWMRGGNARREHGIDKKSVHSSGVFKTRLPKKKKKGKQSLRYVHRRRQK